MDNIRNALCSLGYTRIPGRLGITEDEDAFIGLVLDGERVQKEPMYDSGNDFEGWAMAVHICADKLGIKKKVRLELDEQKRFKYERYEGNGHLGRFLYRAMKFSQQYGDWFELSEYLKGEVNRFEAYLRNGTFVNNYGEGAAGNKNKKYDENAVEVKLAEQGILRSVVKSIDIGDNAVYRQFPVGLFKDEAAKKNMVFTGTKSAIDLWTRNGDEISVVELKTKNVMMGIVTEIYFYSNYMYDLIRDDGLFRMAEPPKKAADLRGCGELYYNRPKKVNGIMLADDMKFHPWVKNGILEVLNDNKTPDLNYYLESYDYNAVIG